MRKLLCALFVSGVMFGIIQESVLATFKEHYDLGQAYLTQYQYSSAINEFKSALKINYLDNSARIGLINAYISHGAEVANNDNNYVEAAKDFRSALFYITIYPTKSITSDPTSVVQNLESNLQKCLEQLKFENTPSNHYATAKKLQAEGNLPAAAYEYLQSLGDKSLQKDSLVRVANILKILGNEPRALDYYKQASFISPTDLKLRLEFAQLLDNAKQDEDALKEYSYVLAKVGNDVDILDSLERIFDKKLNANPNNANLNANLGAIYQKENKLDKALVYYEKAQQLDPSNINTRINTGTLYQQKGDYRMAIKAYDSVLILYPEDVNANLYRAQCYELLGDTKTAQEGFKKVMALDPNNEALKSQVLANAQKTMTSEQYVAYVKNKFAQEEPDKILYDYAIDLHKKNKVSDAIFVYQEVLKLNSKDPDIYVNLALAQAQNKDFEGAISTLNSAKAKYSKNENIEKTLSNIIAMQTDQKMDSAATAYNNQNYQDALNYYLSIKPETYDSIIGVASSYKELGQLDNAIEYYKKALKIKPIDSDLAYYIGCLYGEKEDYQNARDYLEKAIVFDKNNLKAKEYLESIDESMLANLLNDAITLYEDSNYDESLSKLNEYLAHDENNAYALYYRGMIYDAKEKRNEAIADLSKAYEFNKEFTICNYLIASDYDALGKFKEAYNYYSAYATSDVQDDEYKQYAKARAEELKGYAK